jgi:hypothetical protein
LDDIAIRTRGDTTGPLDPRVISEIAEIQRKGRPGFMQWIITLYLQTAAELSETLHSKTDRKPVNVRRQLNRSIH